MSILSYYKKRNGNSNYSRWIKGEAKVMLELILSFPNLGKAGSNQEARILTFSDFGIIYEVHERIIFVISFWDFRQNPEKRIDSRE
jgi:hypothetical protein